MPNSIKGSDASAVDTGAGRAVERTSRVAPAPSATAPPAAPSDSVNITSTAHRLAALQLAVASMPEIDSGRVAALSHAIEHGHYVADPGKIADRLLQLETDLHAATRRQLP